MVSHQNSTKKKIRKKQGKLTSDLSSKLTWKLSSDSHTKIVKLNQKTNHKVLDGFMSDITCVSLEYQYYITLANKNVPRSTSHAYFFLFSL